MNVHQLPSQKTRVFWMLEVKNEVQGEYDQPTTTHQRVHFPLKVNQIWPDILYLVETGLEFSCSNNLPKRVVYR